LILDIAVDISETATNVFLPDTFPKVTNTRTPSSVYGKREEYLDVSWFMNTMFKKSLSIREFVLLFIIFLTMLTLLLTIMILKTQGKTMVIIKGI
jgi:hypothetical protein